MSNHTLLTVTNDGEAVTIQTLEEPQIRWVCDSPRNPCTGPESIYRRISTERHDGCGMAVVRKFAEIGIAER